MKLSWSFLKFDQVTRAALNHRVTISMHVPNNDIIVLYVPFASFHKVDLPSMQDMALPTSILQRPELTRYLSSSVLKMMDAQGKNKQSYVDVTLPDACDTQSSRILQGLTCRSFCSGLKHR